MAGGGSLGGKERVKRGSLATKKKKKKRVGFHMDMTPLVDIAFLLLTFFMLATSLNTPQVMEMTVPPSNEGVDVACSNLFTIRVRDDGKIFYNVCDNTPAEVSLKDLKTLAVNENMRAKNKLITSLKVSTKAKYGIVIDVLDTLNLVEMDVIAQLAGEKRERRFAITPITDKEIEEIKTL